MTRLLVYAALLGLAGCDFFQRGNGDGDDPDTDTDTTDTDIDDDQIPYGADCTAAPATCQPGTVCAGDGTCRFEGEPGTLATGEECFASDYCAFGLACAATGTCASAGSAGTAGLGESCSSASDCQLFLDCDIGGSNTCYGFQPPFWEGAACTSSDDDTGPFRVHFEIPTNGQALGEFYRLPFPNDARVWNGSIDLTGHPTPGVLIPALGDVAADVIQSFEDEVPAWGNNQAAFMRFSKSIDTSTLSLGAPGNGTAAVVDITPSSPSYGQRHSGGYSYSSRRRAYICENWISFHVGTGYPYRANNTYAAIVTTDIYQNGSSTRVEQDDDFAALLASEAPTDATLLHAWEAYAPLRDYLDDQNISTGAIAAAAVFTTDDPTSYYLDLRQAVHNQSTPIADGLHLCESAGGPYVDSTDPDRGCDTVASGYHEVQGTLPLPQFQKGTPPFKEDGGEIDFSQGPPSKVGDEDVVFSMTIPKGVSMPSGGWPVVLYGHGTNGKYRSFVLNGMADELSSVALDSGPTVNFAVISIDQPQHGPRRHPENWEQDWLDLDPDAYKEDVLFFNPLNPSAARDNVLQASSDYFAIMRWLETVNWDSSVSPTGEAVAFDLDQVYYMGHSQGSQTGVGFVAYEPGVQAAVFSGGGGMLMESLLNKTEPVNLPAAIAVGIADFDLTRHHPLLNLAQGYAERSDAVNHGRSIFYETVGDNEPKHVFQTYGIGDSYTPDDAQYGLARSMVVEQVTNGNPLLYNMTEVTPPVTGNRWGTTAVVAQFQPTGGNDGHFVMFDDPDALKQATHFLATGVVDGTPTVVAP